MGRNKARIICRRRNRTKRETEQEITRQEETGRKEKKKVEYDDIKLHGGEEKVREGQKISERRRTGKSNLADYRRHDKDADREQKVSEIRRRRLRIRRLKQDTWLWKREEKKDKIRKLGGGEEHILARQKEDKT